MNVYVLHYIADNPLFEGIALKDWERNGKLTEFWGDDWRMNFQTWAPKSFKATWPTPEVEGNVRKFNDNVHQGPPAFSQRAVDLLRDLLEANGELLPVKHKLGTYYFYNCRRVSDCIDLSKSASKRVKFKGKGEVVLTDNNQLVFVDELIEEDLAIFKLRTDPSYTYCTQRFVDRVEAAGLQGFLFIPIWPLPKGRTYNQEWYRLSKLAEKWKPKDMPALDIKAASVVLRLYGAGKKASKKELAATEDVMTHLEKALYDETQSSGESYVGNVEGHDVVDREIRVFISGPDCDRLVTHLLPSLRTLPWRGKFHVVKRRGEFVDAEAVEEYVPLE